MLALLLALPADDVRTALSSQGVLARSGLLKVDRSGTAMPHNKLDLLSNQFADSVLASETDPIALLRDMVSPSAPAILRPYLAQAVAGNRPGLNIFVYGAPGTGKSAFGRWLAERLDMPLQLRSAST